MDRTVAVLITAGAAALVPLQAPINSQLGKTIGTFAAASVSFIVGTILLVAITVTVGGGFGRVGEIQSLPWYYLMGGVLGAAYMTTILIAVRTLGAGGLTAATIAGQLTMSVVIDRAGILGLPERPITAPRIVGIALLAAGAYLVVRK